MNKNQETNSLQRAIRQGEHNASSHADLRIASVLESLDGVELEKLLKDSDAVLQQINELNRCMREMKEICATDADSAERSARRQSFEQLKQTTLEILERSPSIDGAGLRDAAAEHEEKCLGSVFTRIDFSSYRSGLLTNADSVTQLDQQTFLARLERSRASRLHKQATIQGVRIRARQPKEVSRQPCRAINRLSGVTGVSTSVVGNALFSKMPARATGIPLAAGEILINDVPVAAIDGTEADAICKINETSREHGIHAAMLPDGMIVLESQAGRSIKVAIRSQSAALLTGFSMGVENLPARSCGLLVWLVDTTDELLFDSEETSLALNGCKASKMPMKRFGLADLNCESLSGAQLSLAVLERLYQRSSEQLRVFYKQLSRLCALLSQRVDLCVESVSEALAALETRLQETASPLSR